ncbi:Rnf electron transport complex subunit RnfG [Methanohalophilus mahii]|uniref:Ion-translocating oxidoreductase complex subunit G n=1 Tax=Methanohalophilus mahii (strain ATCC 35705 / DSM 5219 / SLP) TaxID=547558 RepID=D5E7Q0_METMS|nr:Rnf electron transport complex subunit RnfG [Methanohalophilus mahii]ADE37188.1 electron transport complex, RnfABCDGE type, G subunit [Methanohalophilus mahii DSM 5219]
MTESKRDVVIIIGKLVLVCLVASLMLGLTYVPTQEQLEINKIEAQEEAMKEVVPSASSFEPVYNNGEQILYYKAFDSSGNLVGYAFFSEENGYNGPVELAGGIDSSFNTITGMDVMGHSETPGLGAKITEDKFKNQFSNLAVDNLQLSQDGGSIDAITGATTSSHAVVDALNSKIDEIKEHET